jgi:hypothetical protein
MQHDFIYFKRRFFKGRFFNAKDIGWKEIGETFIRYDVVKTRWFNIYVHRLIAERMHPQCHSHPWWFVTLILWGGATTSSRRRRDGFAAGHCWSSTALRHGRTT